MEEWVAKRTKSTKVLDIAEDLEVGIVTKRNRALPFDRG